MGKFNRIGKQITEYLVQSCFICHYFNIQTVKFHFETQILSVSLGRKLEVDLLKKFFQVQRMFSQLQFPDFNLSEVKDLVDKHHHVLGGILENIEVRLLIGKIIFLQ